MKELWPHEEAVERSERVVEDYALKNYWDTYDPKEYMRNIKAEAEAENEVGPHLWKYFQGEWLGMIRKCKKCKKYEFRLGCWTSGWNDEIYLDPFNNDSKEVELIATSFYREILENNKKRTKDCEASNANETGGDTPF